MESSALSAASDARSRHRRSAVTNGTRLHVRPPGDTAWARRFADLFSEIISDMGREGLSEGQRQLARRAAMISLECEKLEASAVGGQQIDLEIYGTLVDRLGRTFGRLGLERRAKDVGGLTLGDLVRLEAQEEAAAAARARKAEAAGGSRTAADAENAPASTATRGKEASGDEGAL